jgi:hypothetical protein
MYVRSNTQYSYGIILCIHVACTIRYDTIRYDTIRVVLVILYIYHVLYIRYITRAAGLAASGSFFIEPDLVVIFGARYHRSILSLIGIVPLPGCYNWRMYVASLPFFCQAAVCGMVVPGCHDARLSRVHWIWNGRKEGALVVLPNVQSRSLSSGPLGLVLRVVFCRVGKQVSGSACPLWSSGSFLSTAFCKELWCS